MMTKAPSRDGSSAAHPADLAYRIYLLAVVGLIVLFGVLPGDHPGALSWIGYHLGLLALGWGGIRLLRWRDHPVTRFLRWWYPLILLYACFKGIGWNIHLLHPGFLDAPLAAADRFLFGTDITLWMQARAHPIITEIMYFCYTGYYLMPLAVGITLYLRDERNGGVAVQRDFREFMFAVTVTFWFCYLHFLFTPAGGPVFWPDYPGPVLKLPGGPIAAFEQWLFHTGGVVGGAFPSSHVAAAFVITAWAVSVRDHRLGGETSHRPLAVRAGSGGPGDLDHVQRLPLRGGRPLRCAGCCRHDGGDAVVVRPPRGEAVNPGAVPRGCGGRPLPARRVRTGPRTHQHRGLPGRWDRR